MTKQYFPLDKDERMQERLMLSLAGLFIFNIILGVYTQSRGLYSYDAILIPFSMFFGGFFYVINGWNGFGKGNLVLKYVPFYLPLLMQFILKKWFSLSPEKARKAAVRSFGILSLLAGTFCLFLGIVSVVKGV